MVAGERKSQNGFSSLGVSLSEVLEYTNGSIEDGFATTLKKKLAGVSTSSGSIEPGELFVALKGEKFDGHDFVEQAFEKGALSAVVRSDYQSSHSRVLLRVKDTLTALGDLARGLRRREKLKVLAVTGSVGKTTVKEFLKSILEEGGPTLATGGNFNNLVGLPLTLMNLQKGMTRAVLEIGANHHGEVAALARIAEPDVGLITTAGAAHLEYFGTMDDVARAKGELFENINAHGVAVVDLDQPLLVRESERFKGNKIFYGVKNKKADIDLRLIVDRGTKGQDLCIHGAGLGLEGLKVRLALPGVHNARNALAAAAAAVAFGADRDEIEKGLTKAKSFPGRLSLVKGVKNYWIIDDSYNANPTSVAAGIEFLADLKGCADKGAILGDMLELGSETVLWHKKIGELVGKKGLDFLAAVGPLSKETAKAAIKAGLDKNKVVTFSDPVKSAEWVKDIAKKGARILIKGSRGIHLEKAVSILIKPIGRKDQ